MYHWEKHGKPAGKTVLEYTHDAKKFFEANKASGVPVTLRDGSPGLLIKGGKGQPGGYFTASGEIVTFWYK
jgi:hypothetical protein